MKIKKTNSEVVYIQKTTETYFEITNDKNETKEIYIKEWFVDSQDGEYDAEETIIDKKTHEEIDTEKLQEWLGEKDDADDLIDSMRELIKE